MLPVNFRVNTRYYDFCYTHDMFVGIDIGGTNTRIVTSKSFDDVIFCDKLTFKTSPDYLEGLTNIIDVISSLGIQITSISIGLPGSVTNKGVLDDSTNLPGWVHKPLKLALENKFNCSIHIKNDAEIGALGEAYFGQVGQSDFFYITWGTGVGCAQIKWDGRTAKVSRPRDRQPIYDLEKLIGGSNINLKFGRDAKDLSEDEWNEVILSLNKTLPSLVKNYGHNTVVIGGGIAFQQKDRLVKELVGHLNITTIITNLEGEAGLYGALALLKTTQ